MKSRPDIYQFSIAGELFSFFFFFTSELVNRNHAMFKTFVYHTRLIWIFFWSFAGKQGSATFTGPNYFMLRGA